MSQANCYSIASVMAINKPMRILDELALSIEQSGNNMELETEHGSLTDRNQVKMKPRAGLSLVVSGALVDSIFSPLPNLRG